MYESDAESLRRKHLAERSDYYSADDFSSLKQSASQDYPINSFATNQLNSDPYGFAFGGRQVELDRFGYPLQASSNAAESMENYPFNTRSLESHSNYFMGSRGQLGASDQTERSQRPLRVVHVGQYMFVAGIESWLRALIRYSDRSNIEFVRCVITGEVHDHRVIRSMGIPVEVGRAAAVQQAARDCDVMLFSGPSDLKSLLGDVKPTASVFVAHGDAMWTQRILAETRELIDHCIAVSKTAQDRICGGMPSTVILNSIDPAHLVASESRTSVRERHGFSEDDFVLGYVGRFSSEKRVELLVQAVRLLPKNVKLLLVGWGALTTELMNLANELIPGRYAFATAESSLGSYYSAMDVHCMVSESEGFGLSMAESMFCGIPLLCTSVGFVPDKLIDRVNCAVVEPSPESIRDTARLLLEHPQWRNAIAVGGRRVIESFAFPQRMCRQYEQTLRQVWRDKVRES
ncbi:MAG: glycosyltransferase [Pirellulaceae bacterium]